jgi:hypothetical protein
MAAMRRARIAVLAAVALAPAPAVAAPDDVAIGVCLARELAFVGDLEAEPGRTVAGIDARLVVAPEVREVEGGPPVGRGLLRAAVAAAIGGELDRVRVCYERALVAAPTLAATIAVRLVVAPDGAVGRVRARGGPAALVACVTDVFDGRRWPRPRGGVAVRVDAALALAPVEPPPPEPTPGSLTGTLVGHMVTRCAVRPPPRAVEAPAFRADLARCAAAHPVRGAARVWTSLAPRAFMAVGTEPDVWAATVEGEPPDPLVECVEAVAATIESTEVGCAVRLPGRRPPIARAVPLARAARLAPLADGDALTIAAPGHATTDALLAALAALGSAGRLDVTVDGRRLHPGGLPGWLRRWCTEIDAPRLVVGAGLALDGAPVAEVALPGTLAALFRGRADRPAIAIEPAPGGTLAALAAAFDAAVAAGFVDADLATPPP